MKGLELLRLRQGGLRPTFSPMPLDEASELLQGLYRVDLLQLAKGFPPVSQALLPDATGRRRLRYIRADPREHWRTIADLWRFGGGDCEDLAAAVAAELTFSGVWVARPVVYQVRPGLAHAVVQIMSGPHLGAVRVGSLLDPSRSGGMGEA